MNPSFLWLARVPHSPRRPHTKLAYGHKESDNLRHDQ